MIISVFLLCFNESALLPHTIKHYKKYLPSCNITILDNESTDNSVKIATELGCRVVKWSSKNILDEFKQTAIKNNCWKYVKTGWIIMADMDEFLCVTEDDLNEEREKGSTILKVLGCEMLGNSGTLDLSDIDLQEIKKYVDCPMESKKLCFLRENINEINYEYGAHACRPSGNRIQYSSTTYINKHMSILGLKFYINKYVSRHKRSENMRKHNMATHYTQNIIALEQNYKLQFNVCKMFK